MKEKDNIQIIKNKYVNFSKFDLKGLRGIIEKKLDDNSFKVCVPFSDCELFIICKREEIGYIEE